MGDSLVNGYPYWLQIDGIQAIWFVKEGSTWLVGRKDNLGTNAGGILGPKGKDSNPNEIKQGWRYATNVWQDAVPNDIIFKAIGTFFKPLLH